MSFIKYINCPEMLLSRLSRKQLLYILYEENSEISTKYLKSSHKHHSPVTTKWVSTPDRLDTIAQGGTGRLAGYLQVTVARPIRLSMSLIAVSMNSTVKFVATRAGFFYLLRSVAYAMAAQDAQAAMFIRLKRRP
jgi:hypothetical protein